MSWVQVPLKVIFIGMWCVVCYSISLVSLSLKLSWIKTKQHNTTTQTMRHFFSPKKESCTRDEIRTHTRHIPAGVMLHQLSYWSSSAGWAQITHAHVKYLSCSKYSAHVHCTCIYMCVQVCMCVHKVLQSPWRSHWHVGSDNSSQSPSSPPLNPRPSHRSPVPQELQRGCHTVCWVHWGSVIPHSGKLSCGAWSADRLASVK